MGEILLPHYVEFILSDKFSRQIKSPKTSSVHKLSKPVTVPLSSDDKCQLSRDLR